MTQSLRELLLRLTLHLSVGLSSVIEMPTLATVMLHWRRAVKAQNSHFVAWGGSLQQCHSAATVVQSVTFVIFFPLRKSGQRLGWGRSWLQAYTAHPVAE